MADEELEQPVEDGGDMPVVVPDHDTPAEEPAAAPAAPESKVSKSGDYTLLMILAFVFSLTSIILAGIELHQDYDVMFFVLSKT